MNTIFNPSEPGISHPIRNTAIRLLDDGRIVILAGNGCGMVFDTDSGEVTIYGKEINFSAEELKIDGNVIDKELICDKRLRNFKLLETSGAITKKLLEQQQKEIS
jgi:hypothetical protein